MREIEIKARVADAAALKAQLEKQGFTLSAPLRQHDRVFGLPGVPGAYVNSEPWLRIRDETAGDELTTYFTLKRSITGQLDSIEHETTAGDPDELALIIKQLGFVPYSDITKTRQTAHIGDIEICVDQVDGLGDFVEAEALTAEDADYDQVITKLWQTLETLGVSRVDEVTDGYDVLVNRQLGRA